MDILKALHSPGLLSLTYTLFNLSKEVFCWINTKEVGTVVSTDANATFSES